MTENANRSTKGRREQRLVPNSAGGNMSICLSTRYTVVPLDAPSMDKMGYLECESQIINKEDWKDLRPPLTASMLPLGNKPL
jgi:hypothetical protein